MLDLTLKDITEQKNTKINCLKGFFFWLWNIVTIQSFRGTGECPLIESGVITEEGCYSCDGPIVLHRYSKSVLKEPFPVMN